MWEECVTKFVLAQKITIFKQLYTQMSVVRDYNVMTMDFNITAHYDYRLSKAWLMFELLQRDTYKMS